MESQNHKTIEVGKYLQDHRVQLSIEHKEHWTSSIALSATLSHFLNNSRGGDSTQAPQFPIPMFFEKAELWGSLTCPASPAAFPGSHHTLLLHHAHTDPGTLQGAPKQAGEHIYKKQNKEDSAQKSIVALAGCSSSHRAGVWVREEGQEEQQLSLSCWAFLLFIFHYGEITFGD